MFYTHGDGPFTMF